MPHTIPAPLGVNDRQSGYEGRTLIDCWCCRLGTGRLGGVVMLTGAAVIVRDLGVKGSEGGEGGRADRYADSIKLARTRRVWETGDERTG